MDINVQTLGAAAGAIAAIWIIVQQIPSIITSFKGESENSALQNNTQAIVQLTQFLQTQSAVDKVKTEQVGQQLNTMEGKLDAILATINTHAVKCDSSCRQ